MLQKQCRLTTAANQNWYYKPSFTAGDETDNVDMSDYEKVVLPHCNRRVPLSGFDDRDYQFVSCYRRTLRIGETFRGKRVFIEFDGAMTATTLFCGGKNLGEYRGGYTPFSFEITDHVNWGGETTIVARVDSSERPDIPPFGGFIDYLTFGGIYRDVHLRVVPQVHIDRIYVKPLDVMTQSPRAQVVCRMAQSAVADAPRPQSVIVEFMQGDECIARAEQELQTETPSEVVVELNNLNALRRWDVDDPFLYSARVSLAADGKLLDQHSTRFGFRECRFTPQGFMLNGRIIKLRGLNRHQTFPWIGAAMPARVQRRDAGILKHELKINMVRTSHYPQSPHFLDACDEIGLLVFEEIPGWQHIGDADWQELARDNVRRMVERDFNHPSIILWGTRINESVDHDEFYTRTNQTAKQLDETRNTGGVRYLPDSNLIEDVFTINDFNPEQLGAPNHDLYMVTEFCGHMYSTKHEDNVERMTEFTRRHAHIQSQAGAMPGMAGALGWCAFDYNTHKEFGSGDRICHHGVADIFRIPKRAAGVYRAQCDPAEDVIIEPGFHWSAGDKPAAGGAGRVYINSNCEMLRIYRGDEMVAELMPLREQFPGLPHPPFLFEDALPGMQIADLRIDGIIAGKVVASRTLSSNGVDTRFEVHADDTELLGDGSDATRIWFMVTDEHGNHRNFAHAAVSFELEGPGELIGDNPFPLIGGCGAVWVRTKIDTGEIRMRVAHPTLGSKEVTIHVRGERRDEV